MYKYFDFPPPEQVISARRVLEALDVLEALVVVCRDLAEVTPTALNL
jgi:hypothetical protein